MSEKIGKLITCVRCPTNIFLKQVGTDYGSNYTDPGYSRMVCEDLPKTWIYDTRFGHLCPTCAREFVNFIDVFFENTTVAPCWHIEEEN